MGLVSDLVGDPPAMTQAEMDHWWMLRREVGIHAALLYEERLPGMRTYRELIREVVESRFWR
jgi:hypothetical protein